MSRIAIDNVILHSKVKDLIENVLDNIHRMNAHVPLSVESLVEGNNITIFDVSNFLLSQLVLDELIIHITVVGESVCFQTILSLLPECEEIIQGTSLLGKFNAVCLLRFL